MMLAAVLMLFGSMCLSSAHGLGDLKALELDHGIRAETKLDPVVENFGSYKYYIPGFATKWTDAIIYCAKVGGVLTDIRSSAEFNFLQKSCEKAKISRSPWVGAAAVGANQLFVWITDPTKVDSQFWRKTQPIPKDGHCVTFVYWTNNPGLEVHPCHEEYRRFICKLPIN